MIHFWNLTAKGVSKNFQRAAQEKRKPKSLSWQSFSIQTKRRESTVKVSIVNGKFSEDSLELTLCFEETFLNIR